MKSLYLRLKSFINTITGSIAFYPTFYAILAIVVAFLMKWAESLGISGFFQENLSALVINDFDTARNILTTLIAGGISILVFTFSMVMLLLSQAATNYSPRVLPGLISNRTHQTILGAFLSSIIFNIITLVGIEPNGENYQIPGFSVLIGIISAFVALGAFVYFIHSISTSIQINNILKNIYLQSKSQLLSQLENDDDKNDFPNTDNWETYNSQQTGTIQNISNIGLKEYCTEHDIKLDILFCKGDYLISKSPLFKASKSLEEEQVTEILKNFHYQESEIVRDNYVLGFKQITEIGIKAMSPGINDPGTALNTINSLTHLFALRLQRSDFSTIKDEDTVIARLKMMPFKQLIHNVLAPYRNYCKHDFIVMMALKGMINRLKECEFKNDEYRNILDEQLELLMQDAENSIDNPTDLEILKSIA